MEARDTLRYECHLVTSQCRDGKAELLQGSGVKGQENRTALTVEVEEESDDHGTAFLPSVLPSLL